MTLRDRIAMLRSKEVEMKKLKADFDEKEKAFAQEVHTVFQELGLPSQFSILQVIDQSLSHTEIKVAGGLS